MNTLFGRRCLIDQAMLYPMIAFLLGLVLSMGQSRVSSAIGLLEVSGGLTEVLGGQLNTHQGGGVQLTIGLGGRPSWAKKGTAFYGYGAISYDRMTSTGPIELGEPLVRREQLSLGLGVRGYWLIKGPVRFWVGLGFDEIFENASILIEGFEPHELSDQALAVTGSVGLQYKWRPRLLVSIAYQITRFGNQEQTALIERSALVTEGDGPWGRGRASLGFAYIF